MWRFSRGGRFVTAIVLSRGYFVLGNVIFCRALIVTFIAGAFVLGDVISCRALAAAFIASAFLVGNVIVRISGLGVRRPACGHVCPIFLPRFK